MNDVSHGGVVNLLRMAKIQFGVSVAFATLRREDGSFALATYPTLGPEGPWTADAVDELVTQTWGDPLLSGGKVLVRSGHVMRGLWPGQGHPTKLAAAALSDLDSPHHPWGLLCVAEPAAGHFEQSQLDLLGSMAGRLTAYLRARQQVVEEASTGMPTLPAELAAPAGPDREPEEVEDQSSGQTAGVAGQMDPERPGFEPLDQELDQFGVEAFVADQIEIETDEMETGEMETDELGTGEMETDELETGELETGELETGELETGELETGEQAAQTGDQGRSGPVALDPASGGRYFDEEPFGYVAEDEELIAYLRQVAHGEEEPVRPRDELPIDVDALAEELAELALADLDLSRFAARQPEATDEDAGDEEDQAMPADQPVPAEPGVPAGPAPTLAGLGRASSRWSFGDDPAAQLFRPEPLTGLVGLPSLMGGLGQALGYLRSADPGEPARLVALAVVDVAPAVGAPPLPDVAYMIIAARLRALAAPGDLVARIGENTFANLMTPVIDSRDPVETRQRMADAVVAPMEPSFGELICRAAMETAVADHSVPGPEDMFRRVLSQLGAM